MKTIYFILTFLFLTIFVKGQVTDLSSNTQVRETYLYTWSIHGADTLTFVDAISVKIFNQKEATDSILISGNTGSVSGTSTSSIKLAPGISCNLPEGLDLSLFDSVTVIIRANAQAEIIEITKTRK